MSQHCYIVPLWPHILLSDYSTYSVLWGEWRWCCRQCCCCRYTYSLQDRTPQHQRFSAPSDKGKLHLPQTLWLTHGPLSAGGTSRWTIGRKGRARRGRSTPGGRSGWCQWQPCRPSCLAQGGLYTRGNSHKHLNHYSWQCMVCMKFIYTYSFENVHLTDCSGEHYDCLCSWAMATR